jgi:hypothetical protein
VSPALCPIVSIIVIGPQLDYVGQKNVVELPLVHSLQKALVLSVLDLILGINH